MSEWTPTKLPIAIPAQHRDLGNKAADLFDPNTEGNRTFPPANAYVEGTDTTPTHCLVRTQLIVDFVPMLEYRDPNVWEPVLQQMAEQRGKAVLTREEIELLCEVMLFGDECNSLIEITK